MSEILGLELVLQLVEEWLEDNNIYDINDNDNNIVNDKDSSDKMSPPDLYIFTSAKVVIIETGPSTQFTKKELRKVGGKPQYIEMKKQLDAFKRQHIILVLFIFFWILKDNVNEMMQVREMAEGAAKGNVSPKGYFVEMPLEIMST